MRFTTFFSLLTAVLISTTPANAQSFRFGLEAGTGYSTFVYSAPFPEWNPGGRTSFNGGLVVQRELSRLLSLESGVRISLLRNKVQFEPTANSPEIEGSYGVSQTYLSLPVHLLMRPRNGSTYFFIGPEVSYLLSAIIRVDTPTLPEDQTSELDNSNIVDTLERPGFFLGVGLGHELPVGNKQIHLKLAYNFELSSTGRDESEWISSWKARDFSIRIGYFL